MNTNLKFDFDDINLVPRYSIVDSRSECDTSIKFGKYTFKNPVMPANMESVINEELAIKLSQEGYFYVMHRFNFDSKSFIKKMKELNLVSSISIGVNEDSYNLLTELKNENIIPDYVTIDIAHGHSKKMKRMIKFIKENFGDDIFIIAGNVSSIEATVDLDKWGADAIKVGVGPGCFTPDAKVLTKNGFKTLKEIKINDEVKTHKNRFKKVLHKHQHEQKHTMLKINNLPLCTPTHEYYVINKIDKEIINEKNIEEYAYWVMASDLDKNKHLLVKL
ncbi:MAG: IMP dehydrogenase [Saccharofermentanales bacterium]